MLTKKQAINIGKAVVQAAKNELKYHENTYEQECNARSLCSRSLDYIWGIFDDKLKAQFDWNALQYVSDCGFYDLLEDLNQNQNA